MWQSECYRGVGWQKLAQIVVNGWFVEFIAIIWQNTTTYRTFPWRLYVPTLQRGVWKLEIANCDIQYWFFKVTICDFERANRYKRLLFSDCNTYISRSLSSAKSLFSLNFTYFFTISPKNHSNYLLLWYFFCNFVGGLSSFHFGRHSVSNLCKNRTSSNTRKICDSWSEDYGTTD